MKLPTFFDKHERNRNAVFNVIVDRAPNGVPLEIVRRKLSNLTVDEIVAGANALAENGLVRIKEELNTFTGRTRVMYELADPLRYPIREVIRIGSHDFPRFMTRDLVGAEDINEPLEALSEYAQGLEKRFVQISNEQTQRYWANAIVLFGLFLAVFTIILSAIPKITIDSSWNFQQVLYLNTAAILPQFAVLVVFVFILWIVFRHH